MSRGQIIPKDNDIPHKKFLVRVYVGRDDTGKRKYHSETVTGTISQAKAKLNEMLGGIATGSFVAPSKMTVSSYLEQWLTNKRDIEDHTAADYRSWMERCVIPVLGTVKLGKLTKLHIQRLYGSLSSDHNYSKRTLTYIHSILRQGLAAAVSDRLIAHNPCDGAQSSIPKVDANKQQMVALTFEQTRDLIEKTKGEKWGVLWRLLLTTGLRPQEALALKWTDVSKGYITINRAIVRLKGNGHEARDFHTKRPASRRQVTISGEMERALEEFRKEQLKEMMKHGTRTEFVFATKTGRFLDLRVCRRYWKAMIVKHGLPDCRLYDARHTHLTQLLSSGINAKAVAARAGHANATVLLSTYAHVLPEVAVDAANIIERRMSNAGRTDLDGAQVGPSQGLRVVGDT